MGAEQQAIVGRIKTRMAVLGMNQVDLAQKAQMSVWQINRVMKDGRRLTAGELGSIAEALDVNVQDLLSDAAASDGRQSGVSLAARLGGPGVPDHLKALVGRAVELLETRDLLDRILSRETGDRPPLELPTDGLAKEQGARLARLLRGQLGLGDAPIDDLEVLAARFGLDASVQELPDSLHGLLVTATGPASAQVAQAVALVNGAESGGRRRFTLAHELGHLLYSDGRDAIVDYKRQADQRDGYWSPEERAELRADAFAAHLLAPDGGVQALAAVAGPAPAGAEERVSWCERLMLDVAARFRVSVDCASRRARDVGCLSGEAERKAVYGGLQSRGIADCLRQAGHGDMAAELVDPAAAVEPPVALLSQALAAYKEGMLGLRPLARLYGLEADDDVADLRQSVDAAGWAPAYA